MDIKLRAKLSAYSRVSGTTNSSGTVLPPITNKDDGSVLGVDDGKITLFPTVPKTDIDALFDGLTEDDSLVTKEEIDTLFGKSDDDTIGTVSHSEIDSLFD